jgi:glycosyltransferase involved in cell wall biosynthesis
MNILIITKNFVREVSYFVNYVVRAESSLKFHIVMPHASPDPLPTSVTVTLRKSFFSNRMRAACYAPSLLWDIKTCRPDILHIFEEYSGLLAFQSVFFNKLLGQRSKIMVYSAENLRHNLRPMFRLSGKYVANRSDLAFVCSDGVKQILEEEGYPKPIVILPLGVDPQQFSKFPADRLKTHLNLDKKFVIGYIGRLLQIKGVDVLVDLMCGLPEYVHLLLIGSGPEEQNLLTTIVQCGLEHRIRFMGNVPYDQLPQYLNCLDLGIVPSRTTKRWQEQFGRVLIELMSCEVPVVGSDSGSIPEVIGEAGFIFHEQKPQELIDRVRTLMEQPEKRKEFGKLGRERVLAHYSLDIMCERFLAMYQQLR